MALTFEDFQPGHLATLGPRHVTRAEIIAFAAEFDPQPMHLDEEAARRSMAGGLSGSGWHMCALAMRMQVDGNIIKGPASISGLGVDEVKWLAPLRPGDDITLQVHVVEARASRSQPDRGVVKIRAEMFNASGVMLMSLVSNGLFRRREAGAAAG
jgi:acyl dehydratase